MSLISTLYLVNKTEIIDTDTNKRKGNIIAQLSVGNYVGLSGVFNIRSDCCIMRDYQNGYFKYWDEDYEGCTLKESNQLEEVIEILKNYWSEFDYLYNDSEYFNDKRWADLLISMLKVIIKFPEHYQNVALILIES